MNWSEQSFTAYLKAVDDTLEAFYDVASDQDELEAIADAHQSELKALRMEGVLIERERAERFLFGWYRQLRDIWLAWPARISAQLAQDLGSDHQTIHRALEGRIRSLLAELADTEPTGIE